MQLHLILSLSVKGLQLTKINVKTPRLGGEWPSSRDFQQILNLTFLRTLKNWQHQWKYCENVISDKNLFWSNFGIKIFNSILGKSKCKDGVKIHQLSSHQNNNPRIKFCHTRAVQSYISQKLYCQHSTSK